MEKNFKNLSERIEKINTLIEKKIVFNNKNSFFSDNLEFLTPDSHTIEQENILSTCAREAQENKIQDSGNMMRIEKYKNIKIDMKSIEESSPLVTVH